MPVSIFLDSTFVATVRRKAPSTGFGGTPSGLLLPCPDARCGRQGTIDVHVLVSPARALSCISRRSLGISDGHDIAATSPAGTGCRPARAAPRAEIRDSVPRERVEKILTLAPRGEGGALPRTRPPGNAVENLDSLAGRCTRNCGRRRGAGRLVVGPLSVALAPHVTATAWAAVGRASLSRVPRSAIEGLRAAAEGPHGIRAPEARHPSCNSGRALPRFRP